MTATVAMVVISLVGRYATVVRFAFLEETPAGTSQEDEDAEQLLHTILKVKSRRFEHGRSRASGLPRPERRIAEEADAGPAAPLCTGSYSAGSLRGGAGPPALA